MMFGAMALMTATLVAPAVPAGDPAGYRDVATGRNVALIESVDAADALQADDPAVLINLGVAYAREGDDRLAAVLFEAAMMSANRCELETATGDWVDSRRLAQRALDKLAQGAFITTAQSLAIADANPPF